MTGVSYLYIPQYTDSRALKNVVYNGQNYPSIQVSGYPYPKPGWCIIGDEAYSRLNGGGDIGIPDDFVYFSSVAGQKLYPDGKFCVQYTVPGVDSLSALVGGNLNIYFMIMRIDDVESPDVTEPKKLYGQYDDISDAQEAI